MLRPISRRAVASAVIAFVGMVALAVSQEIELSTAGGEAAEWGSSTRPAGFAGAAAAVLPGERRLSAAAHGAYVPVLDAISAFRQALSIRSVPGLMSASIPLVAIGIGVVLGVVVVSNVIRWLLHRYREATLGALLGLLLGAVAGLWPFRMPVPPPVGTVVLGTDDGDVTVISDAHARTIELKRWPTRSFTPDAPQLAGAVGLIAVGFGISIAVGWLGTSARTTGSSGAATPNGDDEASATDS